MKYKYEIKKIKSEKREALFYILRDYLIIYFRSLYLMPDEIDKRTKLGILVNEYIKYDYNELKILKLIKEYYSNQEDIEEIENILDELDDMFNNLFGYFDDVFGYYEDMLLTGESYRAVIPKKNFVVLDRKTKSQYVKKITNYSQK